MALDVRPVTAERWDDLVALFGPSGAYSGCWCMWWRVTSAAFTANGNAGNRAAMEALVAGGTVPGLLAYDDGRPVGWVSVGPVTDFGRLRRSPDGSAAEPVDGAWSVNCFFVARSHRGRGVSHALLAAAVDHARAHGATCVEAVPVGPDFPHDAGAYTGRTTQFRQAGFEPVPPKRPTGHKKLHRLTF